MIWHILGILAFVVIYNIWRYNHEDERYEYCPEVMDTSDNNQKTETNMEEKISARQVALNTIEIIGSVPQYTDEGYIQFDYQGITFLIEATNECAFVNLIWPWCYAFSKFDIDEFARVRQVANDINARGVVSTFYSVTDSDDVAVHLKKNFLLVQQIPDLDNYLRLILDAFFRTARMLEFELEKRKMQECETRG